jgi:predicted permease
VSNALSVPEYEVRDPVRIRLRLERLRELVVTSGVSQNHWAKTLGLSRGHWSDLVNGKHPYPSAGTRARMLEAFGVALDDLFLVELHPGADLAGIQAALDDRYVTDRELAHGGMGTVYLGRDLKHGRVVGIKVVSAEAVGGIGSGQFLREIGYISRLQHPHILPLLDTGVAAGSPFYVMPYIRGGSLRDRLRETTRLSLDETLRVVRGVAAALAHAHAHHVLHCDVKPENVLLDGEHPYVMDFGIARAIHAEARAWGRSQELDSSAGTPAYVSPEQANGDPELDGRSDLYSLGCLTFEMLTGRPPFGGRTTMEVVARRFTGPGPAVRDFAPDVPRAAAAEVERAMALARADRHATVADFATALDQAARGSSRLLGATALAATRALGAVRARVGLEPSQRLGGFMDAFWQDIRFAFRTFRRRPGFALAAILTLAVGIGASTAIFSILQGTLLRPLPYPQPERLLRVRGLYLPTGGSGGTSVPNYLDLERQTETLAELVAFSPGAVNLAAADLPVRAPTVRATANFLPGLGVAPALGRGFAPGEDREGAPRVVVLTDRLWRDRFGGRADALGQIIELDAQPHTVVGVLPASFWFPGDPQLVVPYAWTPHDLTATRGNRRVEVFGRVAPGFIPEGALDELQRHFTQIAATYPNDNTTDWTIATTPAREWMLGVSGSSLWLLAGAVALLLLIGCVNVANLLLVRAERRQRETAVRAAVGAGRGRLVRALLAESLTLAALGCVVGIGLSWATTRLLLSLFGSTLPRADDVRLGIPVIAFAAGLALLTGLLVGLVPALRLKSDRLYQGLRDGGRGAAAGRSRLQNALVILEVGLAVLLVSAAGLLMNSFWRLNRVETGINADRALTFRVELPAAGYPTDTAIARYFERALAAIAALPGVQAAGITDRTPLLGGYNITSLPSPVNPELVASFVEIRWVTPGFFSAAGIPLLQGRLLTEADGRAGADVVVISDALAQTLFPAGDAVGHRIDPAWNDGGFEIVGVVGSVREFGVTRDKRPAFYRPFAVETGVARSEVFIVRTATDEPLGLLPSIRRALTTLDPTVPLFGAATMRDVVRRTVGTQWFATALFAAVGLLALALAALGIFAVLAFSVEQRAREVGIRMALGATRERVTRLVVSQGLRLTLTGLVLGLGTAVFALRLLASLLYEVRPADPATLALVTLVAVAAAASASYLPARRAASIEPMRAVSEE